MPNDLPLSQILIGGNPIAALFPDAMIKSSHQATVFLTIG